MTQYCSEEEGIYSQAPINSTRARPAPFGPAAPSRKATGVKCWTTDSVLGLDRYDGESETHLPSRFSDAFASRVSGDSAAPRAILANTVRASGPPTASNASTVRSPRKSSWRRRRQLLQEVVHTGTDFRRLADRRSLFVGPA